MRNWEYWRTNIETSNTHRMVQQLVSHTQHSVQGTSTQDLRPGPCADNVNVSVLVPEMMVLSEGENPTRTLTWKTLSFLLYIITEKVGAKERK